MHDPTPPPPDVPDSLRRLADLDPVSTLPPRARDAPHAPTYGGLPDAPRLSIIAPLRSIRSPTADTLPPPSAVRLDAITGTASFLSTDRRPTDPRDATGDGAPRSPAPPPPDIPDYELIELVGRGGQGEVWRAIQRSLHREVAVKRLTSGSEEEFLQEAYTTAELDHPNIVPVHDLGRVLENGAEHALIAMKLVAGSPWDRLLYAARGDAGLRTDDFLATHLRILIDVCNAVAFAHSRGIIHRDLKPSQVMVGEFGEVLLMDWGLSVSLGGPAPRVAPGSMPKHRLLETASNQCGSPAYMAPEQTEESPQRLGRHTDVYLLGAILYELLAGRPPHHASSARAAYLRAAANDIDPLPEEAPRELRDLAFAALSTDPARRPSGARAVREALEDFLNGAGRRRESAAIARDVRAALDQGTDLAAPHAALGGTGPRPSVLGGGDLAPGSAEARYAHWMELGARLSRALRLWPGNTDAEALYQRVVVGHAEEAIAAGDLVLARTLVAPLPAARRTPLRERIAREEGRQRRLVRQRRLLQAATVTLALVVVTLVGVWRLREATLTAERAERALERERAEAVAARLAEEERRADLLRRANALRIAEERLEARLRGVIPPPHSLDDLDALDARRATVDPDLAAVLLAERASLLAERADLEAAHVLLGSPPPTLLLGEANLLYRTASSTADRLAALAAYEAVLAARPDLPEAHVGIAFAQISAGRMNLAPRSFQAALDLMAEQQGREHPQYAATLILLADTYRQLAENEEYGITYGRFYEEARAILEPRWIEDTGTLARLHNTRGDFARAAALSSATLVILGDDPDAPGRRVLVMRQHAGHLAGIGDRDASIRTAREALAIAETSPTLMANSGPGILQTLAGSLFTIGRHDEAIEIGRAALELSEAARGRASNTALMARGMLASQFSLLSRFSEAEAILRDGIEMLEQDQPENLALRAMLLGELAQLHLQRHDFAAAEPIYRSVLEMLVSIYGPDNHRSLILMGELANALNGLRRHEEADTLNVAVIEAWRRRYGPRHPGLIPFYNNYATSLDDQGRHDEGLAYYILSLDVLRHNYGLRHPNVTVLLFNLAVSLHEMGHVDDALLAYRLAHATARRGFGDTHFHSLAIADDTFRRFLRPAEIGRDPEAAALVLSVAAWLEDALDRRPESSRFFEVRLRIATASRLGRVVRELAPDRHDLLRRVARRIVANVVAAGPGVIDEETIATWRGIYGPYLDFDETWAAVPPPHADWWAGERTAIPTGSLRAHVDAFEPRIDWAAEFPGLVRDPAALDPSGEELTARVTDVLRAALERAGLDPSLIVLAEGEARDAAEDEAPTASAP